MDRSSTLTRPSTATGYLQNEEPSEKECDDKIIIIESKINQASNKMSLETTDAIISMH